MKVITGNLLTLASAGEFDAIMHGCNCFHGEDSGIAGQIWEKYPDARLVSEQDHESGNFDAFGEFSTVYTGDFSIINAYTQYFSGRSFYMPAFISILQKVNTDFSGSSIGIPAIGCGIGGSTLDEVLPMILKHAPNINWTLVLWDGVNS